MKLVYIAGPFRAADAWEVHCNVHRAELASREVAGMGAMPVAPHSIGAHMDGTETAEFWLSGTLELMRRCDAVLVLSGYEHSAGTLGEIQEAKRLGLPLFLPHQHGPAFTSLFVWLRDNAAVHTTPVLPLSDEAPETKRCQYCGQGFAVLRAGHIFCSEKCRERATIAAQVEAMSGVRPTNVPEPIEEPVTAKIQKRPEPDKLAEDLWAEAGLDADGVSDALMWGDGAGSDGAVRS